MAAAALYTRSDRVFLTAFHEQTRLCNIHSFILLEKLLAKSRV